jgi:hypothetical protein
MCVPRSIVVTLIAAVALTADVTSTSTAAKKAGASTARPVVLPLLFESTPDGKYRARSVGYTVEVGSSGVAISLPRGAALQPADIRISFPGARAGSLSPEQQLTTTVNYLKGRPEHWRTALPTYGRVRIRQPYPGIDAVFYGNDRHLEYDFVVAAGASAEAIAMTFEGADAVSRSASGDLVIAAGGRELTQHAPVAYQEINGRRVMVDAAYLVDGVTARLALGDYDHALPLVIDPVVSYSTYWGGSDSDMARGAVTDAAGCLYVAGYAQNGDFLLPSNRPHGGHGQYGQARDAYVVKFSPDGTPVWMTFLGGAEDDYATDIAVGPGGDLFITGGTSSTDFPATPGAYDSVGHNAPLAGREPGDAFVVRLSADGTTIRYATYLGGGQFWGGDSAAAIAVDAQGRAHVVGETGTADFPVTIAASRKYTPDYYNREAFVAKFSADGSRLEFSRLLSGADYETATDVLLDQNGGIFVVGTTSSTDFPVLNAVQPTKFGPNGHEGDEGRDGFLTHLWTDGSIVYSTFLGGPGEDDLFAVARGLYDRLYVAGATTSDGLPGSFVARPGAGANDGNWDGMVMHLAPNASVIFRTQYVGGSEDDFVASLAVDPAKNLWLAGSTYSPDITPYLGASPAQSTHGGLSDVFTGKWSADLSGIDYGTLLGGAGYDYGYGVAVDPNGNAYVVGTSQSEDYPVQNARQPALAPATAPYYRYDGVITRFGCSITVFGTSQSAPADAGAGSVSIYVESGCRALAASSQPWLRVTGVDADSVEYAFDANTSSSSRSATIDISGTGVTVTQAAASTPPPGSDLEIVLSPGFAPVIRGTWRSQPHDAGGTINDLLQVDMGAAKINTPFADPGNYFELTFNAVAGRPYRLWLRGKGQNDYWANDSVHVQFSDSVDDSGNAVYRIGTTSATSVNLEECGGCGLSGWGWEDNGWGAPGVLGPAIRFAASGIQTIRIQQREDGFQIHQIVLSAERYLNASPGLPKNDTTTLAFTNVPPGTPPPPANDPDEVVLYGASFSGVGNWVVRSDATAAGGSRLWNPNANAPKVTAALATPSDYTEATFNADAGKPYRVWLRMQAENNYWGNDSVWVQFSGSVNGSGTAINRIGTSNGTWISLEECSGCAIDGWGWQDDGYGATGKLGTVVYFATSGPQTIRIQRREDGVAIDQVVISAGTYLNAAPGSATRDATIVPK